ncbi:UNVERIFIED_CONTAM: Protein MICRORCHIDIA 6, partial [Sesamum indicum]
KLTQSVGLLSYTFLMQTRQDRIVVPMCDDIGPHGTKIIVYNLWHNDEGKMELDFESDPEAYLSILYLRVPENFIILLRGRVVEYHNIANDLKFPEFILYKPQNVEPFWHVVTYSDSRGRGVVGVLEANFIEPSHNKQDFEKTPVFQKLETRLKEMTQEYWDYHCGLIGYQVKKKPQATMMSHSAKDSRQVHGVYQPVLLGRDSSGVTAAKASLAAGATSGVICAKTSSATPASRCEVSVSLNHVAATSGIPATSSHRNSLGAPLKRKANNGIGPERVKKMVATESKTVDGAHGGDVQITLLMAEVREAHREHARLLLESKLLEKVKQEHRQIKPV